MLRQGSNLNTDDEAIVADGVELNPDTSVVISPANDKRTFIHIDSNDSNNSCWIKFQPAATDDDKKGIFFSKSNSPGPGSTTFTMKEGTVYTGEISAISDTGNPIVYVTEF